MISPLVLLLLCPAIAAPQTTAAPSRWKIESLAVEGNRNYSAGEILAVARLKAGQMAGKEEMEAARGRLMETGVFESAGYRFRPSASGQGIAVTIQVVEVEPVYPFRLERLDIEPKELEEWLRRSDQLFRDRIPATQPVLDRYVRSIEAFLAARNRKEAVAARLTAGSHGQMVIVFNPAAPPPSVAEVRFTGNSVISEVELRNVIAKVAIGVPYTEPGFRELLDSSVRPLYDALGRIRVAFPKLQVEKARQADGVAVTVEVVEGSVYELGEVRLEGEELPAKELEKVADFKTGEVADFSEIGAGLDRIKKRLRRYGFLKVETTVERILHDQQKKVDLVVRVDKGPLFAFGKLVIEGLDLNGEAEVRRRWGIKPGAPFNADYPDLFLGRIREDGLFDNLGKTRSAIKIDEQSRTVDVTLSFR